LMYGRIFDVNDVIPFNASTEAGSNTDHWCQGYPAEAQIYASLKLAQPALALRHSSLR